MVKNKRDENMRGQERVREGARGIEERQRIGRKEEKSMAIFNHQYTQTSSPHLTSFPTRQTQTIQTEHGVSEVRTTHDMTPTKKKN
jgi:hypothetical protein